MTVALASLPFLLPLHALQHWSSSPRGSHSPSKQLDSKYIMMARPRGHSTADFPKEPHLVSLKGRLKLCIQQLDAVADTVGA